MHHFETHIPLHAWVAPLVDVLNAINLIVLNEDNEMDSKLCSHVALTGKAVMRLDKIVVHLAKVLLRVDAHALIRRQGIITYCQLGPHDANPAHLAELTDVLMLSRLIASILDEDLGQRYPLPRIRIDVLHRHQNGN